MITNASGHMDSSHKQCRFRSGHVDIQADLILPCLHILDKRKYSVIIQDNFC